MPCESDRPTFKICRCACKWRCQCLIPRIKKPHPPFNSGSQRGVNIGLHPKFYAGQTDSPAIGLYDPARPKSRSGVIDWKREVASEEFSATKGGKFLEEHEIQRDSTNGGPGPGSHDISQWPENVLEKKCKSIKRDFGLGTRPFEEPAWVTVTPGPGYTLKNPYYYIDKRRREGSSCVPTFEYDRSRRFRDETKSWNLPCNLYRVKEPNTLDALLRKTTGKRGPYDLFTGPRDDSTIKGYFAKAKLDYADDWTRTLPNEIEKLLHKSKYFKGRWSTCPRFPKYPGLRIMLNDLALCYKDPNQPGPGQYDPKAPRKPRTTKNYPFDVNVEYIRSVPSTEIKPGPGRYNVKGQRAIPGHGWTFVFKSKVPRTKFIVIPEYNAF